MAITTMSHEERQNMSAAAMRTYPNIVRDWGLKEQEAALLLGVPDGTYRRWKQAPEKARLDQSQMERMSLILGIYKALQILLPRTDAADSWLRRANRNPLFSGQAPLDRLRSGLVSDLYVVRQHLDGARGAGHA
ncbi:antitoxin Xre-like helix-turn-helix domain-containing protein [Kushneria sp. EE4]